MIKNPMESLEILLRFWKFVDWKIADVGGELCLVLPMDKNGIDFAPNGELPFMRLLLSRPKKGGGKDGFIRILTPTMPRRIYERLVEQGDVEARDKIRTNVIGGIRPLLWASTHNRDLGSSYDKVFGLKMSKDKDND